MKAISKFQDGNIMDYDNVKDIKELAGGYIELYDYNDKLIVRLKLKEITLVVF